MRSDALGNTLLPKRIALPVFASDALSSVAYAPDEILLTLSFAGLGVTALSPAVGLAVVVLLVVVVASYRQTVKAYPSGGGDYEVATKNLGGTAGLVVASALLVDYVLTVAVSISSGAQYLSATFPVLAGSEALIGSLIIAVLALLNLRGMRESGKAFAIPTYLYLVAIGAMICTGIFQWATGSIGHAPTAMYEIAPKAQYSAGLVGIGGAILMLRAFSSGCAALTGVEAIANGVPAFKKPKSKNAATTLALLGTISAAMLMSILLLAGKTGVRSVENPATDLLVNGKPVGTGISVDPVIGQLAATIFANADVLPGYYRHWSDPGSGCEYRFQWFSAAGAGTGAGFLPTSAALQSWRSPVLFKRHLGPSNRGNCLGSFLRCPSDSPDPAVHRWGVHRLYYFPVGHGRALEP